MPSAELKLSFGLVLFLAIPNCLGYKKILLLKGVHGNE
jgi:hypothetical protein